MKRLSPPAPPYQWPRVPPSHRLLNGEHAGWAGRGRAGPGLLLKGVAAVVLRFRFGSPRIMSTAAGRDLAEAPEERHFLRSAGD